MPKMMVLPAAVIALWTSATTAFADQCSDMMSTTTVMCASSTYSSGTANKVTVTFGPGNSFTGVGASKSNKGDTLSGTYECFGNNYYQTAYTDNFGENVIWLARFPSTYFGTVTSGPFGIYMFSGKVTQGACP